MSRISDKLAALPKGRSRAAQFCDPRQMEFFPEIARPTKLPVDVAAPEPPRVNPLSAALSAAASDPPPQETPPAIPQPPPPAAPSEPPPADAAPEERLLRAIIGDKVDALRKQEEVQRKLADDHAALKAAREETERELQTVSAESARWQAQAVEAQARLAQETERLAGETRRLREELERRTAETERFADREHELKQRCDLLRRAASPAAESGSAFSTRRLVALAIVVLIACGLAYTVGRRQRSARQESVRPVVVPAAPPVALSGAVSPSAAGDRPAVPQPPAWPALTLAGVQTRATAGELTLIFESGIFPRGTEIDPSARRDLLRLAAQLKPHLNRFRLEIEGHTDAAPVTSSGAFGSNRELGLQRANAVRELFVRDAVLPAAALSAATAGEENPPYPNTTPESRRKNRTVVLKLLPRAAAP
jgi:flagellar motor protein MotB